MKLLKTSQRTSPKISLILLDWSVRESFHLLHYLEKQTLAREDFEVIIVEYYSTVSSAVSKFEAQVDSWILLEMPETSYYHKHLMYNVGIFYAKGEIIIICDSDAMAKPSFLASVMQHFEDNKRTILHLDQFRNNRRDLYPFSYPSFEEVMGAGCINLKDGVTTGIASKLDPIHERNYGACFCARREDLIRIGGADEHVDFVGHICGPYDLTFRLINDGLQEVWHQSEFLYHTWHPGQAGENNYLGPHDGRHVSSTSLEMLAAGQVYPHLKNLAISALQENQNRPELLINSEIIHFTHENFLFSNAVRDYAKKNYRFFIQRGYLALNNAKHYLVQPLISQKLTSVGTQVVLDSIDDVERYIKQSSTNGSKILTLFVYCSSIRFWLKKIFTKVYFHLLRYLKKVWSKLSLIKNKLISILKVSRMTQLKTEVDYLAAKQSNLIVNLMLVRKIPQIQRSYLLVSSLEEVFIYQVFSLMKIIPALKVIHVKSFADLSEIQLHSNQHPDESLFIFTQKIYTKYAGLLSASLDKAWIVL